jgi:uncharacterized protein (DUF488 family)
MTSPLEILTIGHSSMSYEQFVRSLRSASVTAVADVRSAPFSRRNPQFNRDALRDELRLDGIAYVFLGEELGGRPNGRQYFCEGVADYEKMAQSSDFERGLRRVIEGSKQYRIALMCSEHDPLECHRCLLVGRALHERGVTIKHILSDQTFLDQAEIERRLIQLSRQGDADLFQNYREQLATAYRKRANKVAFSEPSLVHRPSPRHSIEGGEHS